MKKILSLVLTLCIMLSVCSVPVLAAEEMQPKDIITITIDGEYVDCSKYGQLPVAIDGTTLVPLRSVFEELGATVDWDNAKKCATSIKDNTTIVLTLDSKEMLVNEEIKILSVPATSMNQRIMVPVRAIAEAFGCDVDWDGKTRTVVIVTDDTPEGVVTKVYEATYKLDFETVRKYCKNPEEILGAAASGDINDMIDSVAGSEGLTESAKELIAEFTLNVMQLITFEVGETTIDGDNAEVSVTTFIPDFESFNMEEHFDETTVMSIYGKCLSDLGYTMEDIANITEPAEVEEITLAVTKGLFDYIVEVFKKESKNGEFIEETAIIKLENTNGKWLITEEIISEIK